MTMEADAWVVIEVNIEEISGVIGRKTRTTRTETVLLIPGFAQVWVVTGDGGVNAQLV
jgi:hypothetical protein